MVCVAARLEGGCDLGQRAFSNSKIAAPLSENRTPMRHLSVRYAG
jgi:hypothetical protein